MTIASFLSPRRRVLAICVASVLLHYVAIGWVGQRIGQDSGQERARAPAEPAVIVAQLRAPEPAPVAVAPAPVPAAAPAPAPAAAPAPAPASPAGAPAPVAGPDPQAADMPDAGAGEMAGDMAGNTADDMADDAGAAVQSLASDSELSAPQTEAGVESAPQAAPLPRAQRYKVSLPPSADLTLDVARVDAAGASWSGQMTMSWKQAGGAYTMQMEASISMLVTRVTLASLRSEGAIDADGSIAPRLATEKRRGKSQTATHFDAQEKRITFSASERSYPLLPGTQDKATVPLQLAGIARADSGQLAAGVEMLVGEDKEATVFQFVVVGQEDIETGMGRMATWHLSRPPRAGAYNSRLDIWLAPAHNWYPVRLRNTEGNGAVTTQTIRKIVITDAGH